MYPFLENSVDPGQLTLMQTDQDLHCFAIS